MNMMSEEVKEANEGAGELRGQAREIEGKYDLFSD